MLTRRNGLLAIIGLALGGSVLVPGQARAWHHGVPHGGHHDGDDRRHRGGRGEFIQEEHSRPHHRRRHCREVEYHDHHGRSHIRTVCD